VNTLSLFIVSLGLSMNCFGIAIANSSISGKVKAGIPLKTAIAFGLSHFILAFGGYYLGRALHPTVAGVEDWAVFMIFFIIGVKMIAEALLKKPETRVFDINSARVILALSVALGMNALLAGLALGIWHAPIMLAAFAIFSAVSFFTLSGLAGGQHLGMGFAKGVFLLGGALFLLSGLSFVLPKLF
jgi:putative Mn2+ efflux pump MntP